jgi:hypothetical protein
MATTTASVREDRFRSHVPPVGSVLRWRHQGTTHVALHVGVAAGAADRNESWHTTSGRDHGVATSWEHVRSMIGNNPCSIATGWTDVPLLVEAEFGDDQVGDYVTELRRRQLGVIERESPR